MTLKEIEELAGHRKVSPWVVKLVADAVAKEREACEKLRNHDDVLAPVGNSAYSEWYQDGWIAGTQAYHEAIRARGQA